MDYQTNSSGEGLFSWRMNGTCPDLRQELGTCDYSLRGLTDKQVKRRLYREYGRGVTMRRFGEQIRWSVPEL